MEGNYKAEIIPVGEDGFFITYFKACGAMWHVCYNQLPKFGEEGVAAKQIGGKSYEIDIQSVDGEGNLVDPNKEAQYIRFQIISDDGDAIAAKELEAQLIARLGEIREKNLPYTAPKPADMDIR
jgi:hypothetical protein